MGSKGNSRHINRLAASNYMRINRKMSTYVAKQDPGRHTLENSIALTTLLKEKMNVAADSKEARLLIKKGDVHVNGKMIKNEKYPVGFGDLIHFKSNGETYKIDVAKHGAIKVDKHEHQDKSRTMKVIGKYVAAGNKLMIRLYDGTITSGKKEIMVNDSVTLDAKGVKAVVKFAKGAKCYVMKGTHASESGVIKEISKGTATRDATVEVDSGSGTFQTLLENIMVTG